MVALQRRGVVFMTVLLRNTRKYLVGLRPAYCIGLNTTGGGIFISMTASNSKRLTNEFGLPSISNRSETDTVVICKTARRKRASSHIITSSSLTSTILLPSTPY
jgi:hypothetical protein